MEEFKRIIQNNLSPKCEDFKVLVYDVLESTNQTAKELAFDGEKEGTIVVSLSQTKGRGRMSRSFFSPKDSGIYFSIVLRPEIPADASVLITTAAAVATAKAIEKLSNSAAKIKWVNDIFVNGKKVCGILTESSFLGNNTFDFAILGIGINLFKPEGDFPKYIQGVAGSIFDDNKKDIRAEIVAETVNIFFDYYEDLLNVDFLSDYKARSIVLGKEISYFKNGKKETGIVCDIDNRCRLLVKKPSNEEEILSTGEISLGCQNFI